MGKQQLCFYVWENTSNTNWAVTELGRQQGQWNIIEDKATCDKRQKMYFSFSEIRHSQTNRAVQTQHNDHEEKDDGKESSSRHICDGFCINDEQQTGTCKNNREACQKSGNCGIQPMSLTCCPTSILGHSSYILLPHLCHVAKYGKDDKTRQEASQTVHWAGDQSISEIEKEEGSIVGGRQSTL